MPRKPKMRSNRSILIVDDEFAIRESFRILPENYYDLYTAPGGEEALNVMKQRKFHLITWILICPRFRKSRLYGRSGK
jgi:DNA-binding NtrC family response regulator